MSLTDILESGKRYLSALNAQDYEQAKSIARTGIAALKLKLEDDGHNSDKVLNYALHLSVFFRGLYDFAVLNELTYGNWFENQKTVEAAWVRLWDCRERIGFVRSMVGGTTIDQILAWLFQLESVFTAHFGPGLYASPVILFDREFCSICDEDLQHCPHLPGTVYRGRICAGLPAIRELRGVDFVQSPMDPRCRIWPWQLQGDVISGVCMMHMFRLDDFRETDKWAE